jgi:prophage antirepressor-like protein
LRDLSLKIIKSKSPKRFEVKVKTNQRFSLKNEIFITSELALELIKSTKSKTAKLFVEELELAINPSNHFLESDNSVVDLYRNIYKFKANPIVLFRIENEIWFKGVDIAKILGYCDSDDVIKKRINSDDKCLFDQLQIFSGVSPEIKCTKRTIFINQSGLFTLILGSKLESAKEFKQWISKEVLPKIFEYGSFSTNPTDLSINSFYDENYLSVYSNKHVIYLAYIGYHDGQHYMKYGKSNDFPRRELKEHRKLFDKFQVVHICEVDANDEAENKLKIEWEARQMGRSLVIKNKNIKELIAINNANGVEMCIRTMDNICKNTKLKSQEEYESKIKELDTRNKHLEAILEEKTKQLVDKDELILLYKNKNQEKFS